METNNDVGKKQRRPYLHPIVFDKVIMCEKCTTDERMIFWRNIKMKPDYQLEFLVCPVCGYTVFIERYVMHTATSIDMKRPDLVGFLHDLTKGARAAATKFATEDAKNKSLNLQNIRYVTIADEKAIVEAYYAKQKRDEDERRRIEAKQNDTRQLVVSCENVRANGINFQLKVARMKQEEARKEKSKPAKFECKYCTKKFPTKSALHNHRCNGTDTETYIEKAKRLENSRRSISSAPNASSD